MVAGADLSSRNGVAAIEAAAGNTAGVHHELVQALLAWDVKVDAKDGFTPLMWASSSGDADTVQALLDIDAKVDVQTSDGSTLLNLRAAALLRRAASSAMT